MPLSPDVIAKRAAYRDGVVLPKRRKLIAARVDELRGAAVRAGAAADALDHAGLVETATAEIMQEDLERIAAFVFATPGSDAHREETRETLLQQRGHVPIPGEE